MLNSRRCTVLVDLDSFSPSGTDDARLERLGAVVLQSAVSFPHHHLELIGTEGVVRRLGLGELGVPARLTTRDSPGQVARFVARALARDCPPSLLVSARRFGRRLAWSPGKESGPARRAHVRLTPVEAGRAMLPVVESSPGDPPPLLLRSLFGVAVLADELARRETRDDGAVLAGVRFPHQLSPARVELLAVAPSLLSLALEERVLLLEAIGYVTDFQASELVALAKDEQKQLRELDRLHRERARTSPYLH